MPTTAYKVRPGGFDALRRRRIEEGASPQQLKVSRVVRHAEHLALLTAETDVPTAVVGKWGGAGGSD